ncbi:type I inorganic pyrophosphatase PPase [Cardiosporidium cionae]|uniref:inorganic diphosphatase n=1 Tax=Cardiosporidium cionae TaxID=476202 RepID=A0ABQ7J7K9_9APIC|nr:type I inorganic pyrophosphatase PPase [Cardiosporidium cionae]|eukprot:KAF8819973.1 type I inorganic pyrophosphatase PPase [Cardiosporidium cionae]
MATVFASVSVRGLASQKWNARGRFLKFQYLLEPQWVHKNADLSSFRCFLPKYISCSPRYTPFNQGIANTENFQLFFQDAKSKTISPWHEIPLRAENGLFHMVVEVPKFATAKMEIAKAIEYNPIQQDKKHGKLRHYPGPIYWNYGALPQTWEDPSLAGDESVHESFGDNDPLDIIEIGAEALPLGCVIPVKILGAFSLIDQGELDWKILALQQDDPKFDEIDNLDDIEISYPGTISGIREWFRWYKTPDGKGVNMFGHSEQPIDRVAALKVIEKAHESYQSLINGYCMQQHDEIWRPQLFDQRTQHRDYIK